MRNIFLFLLTVFFFTACHNPYCEKSITEWEPSILQELEEFKAVNNEIALNWNLFNPDNKDSSVFINNYFYGGKSLPILKQWIIKHPSGWISYKNNTARIHYKECTIVQFRWISLGPVVQEYKAYLFYSKDGLAKFDMGLAQIEKSISLENNWYYILTKCAGCGS